MKKPGPWLYKKKQILDIFVLYGILTLTKLKYPISLDLRRYKVALLMKKHSEDETKNHIYVKVQLDI